MDFSVRVVATCLGETNSFCFFEKKVLNELLKQETPFVNKRLIKTSQELIDAEALFGVNKTVTLPVLSRGLETRKIQDILNVLLNI